MPRQLVRHDVLGIDDIQMRQIYQNFATGLVQLNGVALLDEFAHNLAFVVLHDQHFLGPDHVLDHHLPKVGQDLGVLVLAERIVGEDTRIWGSAVHQTSGAHGNERIQVSDGELLHFFVELLNELGPVLEADFENLSILNLRDPNEIKVRVLQVVSIR